MDGWELALLVAAAYLAVVTLVRLMRKRRDQLVADMRQQIEAEKRRQQAKKKSKRQSSRTKKAA